MHIEMPDWFVFLQSFSSTQSCMTEFETPVLWGRCLCESHSAQYRFLSFICILLNSLMIQTISSDHQPGKSMLPEPLFSSLWLFLFVLILPAIFTTDLTNSKIVSCVIDYTCFQNSAANSNLLNW